MILILDESQKRLLGIFRDKYELIVRSLKDELIWDEHLVSLGCLTSPVCLPCCSSILDFVVIPCPGTPFQSWSEYGVPVAVALASRFPEGLHVETTRCIYIPKDLALKTLVLGGLP